MKFTAHEFVRAVNSILPQSLSAASTDGSVVDAKGYGEALVIFHAGTAAAGAEADVTIRESDNSDGSSSSAITGAAFAQVTTTNDNTIYVGRINLEGRKRYLFARNVGDGANAVLLSVAFVLIHPKYAPATQVETLAFNIA